MKRIIKAALHHTRDWSRECLVICVVTFSLLILFEFGVILFLTIGRSADPGKNTEILIIVMLFVIVAAYLYSRAPVEWLRSIKAEMDEPPKRNEK